MFLPIIGGAIGNLETQAFDPRWRGTPPFELRTVGLRGRWKLGDRPAMTALFAVKPTKASPMGAPFFGARFIRWFVLFFYL